MILTAAVVGFLIGALVVLVPLWLGGLLLYVLPRCSPDADGKLRGASR